MSTNHEPQDIPRVAVIGLGAMGLPMAGRLAEVFPVTGFDVAAARYDLLAAAGGTGCGTPAQAAQDADIVLLAVRDYAQAVAALFGADGVAATLRPGGLVVLTSTVGPEAAVALADRLA